ncbi:hypothetical protein EMCRGX_G015376 [Ephydatia muelleri]
MTNVDCVLKLVLVGDSSTGKTTLIHRYVDGKYTPGYAPSIGVDFMYKNIDMDGRKVRLQIWDTAGQERYCSLSSTFCRGAEGILLVYDITNQKSFEGISRWLNSVNMHTSERVMKMLVANKCDQDGRRMETSAEKNMGVSEVMVYHREDMGVSEVMVYHKEDMGVSEVMVYHRKDMGVSEVMVYHREDMGVSEVIVYHREDMGVSEVMVYHREDMGVSEVMIYHREDMGVSEVMVYHREDMGVSEVIVYHREDMGVSEVMVYHRKDMGVSEVMVYHREDTGVSEVMVCHREDMGVSEVMVCHREDMGVSEVMVYHREDTGVSEVMVCHREDMGVSEVMVCHREDMGVSEVMVYHREDTGVSEVMVCHREDMGVSEVMVCHREDMGVSEVMVYHREDTGVSEVMVYHREDMGVSEVMVYHREDMGVSEVIIGSQRLSTLNNSAILGQLQCLICLELLCQPLELPCRALVCTTCMVRWFEVFSCSNVKCPCCFVDAPLLPSALKPAPPIIMVLLQDIHVECSSCKKNIRIGDYNIHDCDAKPTKDKVKMASQVLSKLAATSPDKTISIPTDGLIFESLVRRIIQNSLHISHEHLTSSSNDQLSKTKGKCSC